MKSEIYKKGYLQFHYCNIPLLFLLIYFDIYATPKAPGPIWVPIAAPISLVDSSENWNSGLHDSLNESKFFIILVYAKSAA